MNETTKKSRNIQNIVFGAILIVLFFLVCRLFAPFLSVLLWSILFYVILKPLHQKCTARFNRATLKGKFCINVLSAAFSIGTVILILIPLSFVVFQLFQQIADLIRQVLDYSALHSLSYGSFLENISRIIRDLSSGQIVINADQMRSQIQGYLNSGLQNLVRLSGHGARNLGSFLVSLVFIIFSLFFLFVDGTYLSRMVLHIIPIRKDYMDTLVTKFKEIIQKLVLGYIIVALAEAVTAFIIFSIFRIPGTLVFSSLVFFSAFLPLVGPSLVWIPLGFIRILNGDILGGILLMVISAVFISSIDTFLRPFILKDRIQLHPLIIFFAILGGVSVFGFNGIILGPMIVIIFLTVFDLFLSEHKLEQK